MDVDLERLAKSVVKSRGWHWCEGMVLRWGVGYQHSTRLSGENTLWTVHMLGGGIPDLLDKETKGRILDLVRRMRGDSSWRPTALHHDPTPDWVIETPSKKRQTLYNSYIGALIAALMEYR